MMTQSTLAETSARNSRGTSYSASTQLERHASPQRCGNHRSIPPELLLTAARQGEQDGRRHQTPPRTVHESLDEGSEVGVSGQAAGRWSAGSDWDKGPDESPPLREASGGPESTSLVRDAAVLASIAAAEGRRHREAGPPLHVGVLALALVLRLRASRVRGVRPPLGNSAKLPVPDEAPHRGLRRDGLVSGRRVFETAPHTLLSAVLGCEEQICISSLAEHGLPQFPRILLPLPATVASLRGSPSTPAFLGATCRQFFGPCYARFEASLGWRRQETPWRP